MSECIALRELDFQLSKGVDVVFDGPDISSDGGVLLLHQIDEELGLTEGFAALVPDEREAAYVQHPRKEQTRQRVYQICQGYEDCNDAHSLRHDPVFKMVCGVEPSRQDGLSSQPTLSRFENSVDGHALRRMLSYLENRYVGSLDVDCETVILDIDMTDDPAYGTQEGVAYHGYYRQKMYSLLLIYDGITGELASGLLRGGRTHPGKPSVRLLCRLIKAIRRRCPDADILVRGDSGFCGPKLLAALEKLNKRIGNVYYLLGIKRNPRLERRLGATMERAERTFNERGRGVQLFTDFLYQAKSWPHKRTAIGKAEYNEHGPNPRFVLTNLGGFPPSLLYKHYCKRGDKENHIKDFKQIHGDRLSCHRFTANFFRFLLHALAYKLLIALKRRLAPHPTLANARFSTLQLRLLKVAAIVKTTTRRILVRLPKSFPLKPYFSHILKPPRE